MALEALQIELVQFALYYWEDEIKANQLHVRPSHDCQIVPAMVCIIIIM
jgi:hypothetical protein